MVGTLGRHLLDNPAARLLDVRYTLESLSPLSSFMVD